MNSMIMLTERSQNEPKCVEVLSNLITNEQIQYHAYLVFDIFQKVGFCLRLYTEEINLQTFVMIPCKTICRKYLITKCFILVVSF